MHDLQHLQRIVDACVRIDIAPIGLKVRLVLLARLPLDARHAEAAGPCGGCREDGPAAAGVSTCDSKAHDRRSLPEPGDGSIERGRAHLLGCSFASCGERNGDSLAAYHDHRRSRRRCAGPRSRRGTAASLARHRSSLLHLAGKIPDITLGEVIAYMMPGSDQSMPQLIERRNPLRSDPQREDLGRGHRGRREALSEQVLVVSWSRRQRQSGRTGAGRTRIQARRQRLGRLSHDTRWRREHGHAGDARFDRKSALASHRVRPRARCRTSATGSR